MLSVREEQTSNLRSSGWRNRLHDLAAQNWDIVREIGNQPRCHLSPTATYIMDDALRFLSSLPACSLSAVVTDPPYGVEYEEKDHVKLRGGRGGVWRIPPSFDGA